MPDVSDPLVGIAAEEAVGRLRRLHDGEAALGGVIALGTAARAPLRSLLFEREPSGIWQPRVLAARALGLLHADDILLDFLLHPRFPPDPVEYAGEEAAVNGAAEALGRNHCEEAFPVLRALVDARPHLIGAVHALASYDRPEAAPALVKALGDDGSRRVAEEGLARLGADARAALLACISALGRDTSAACETNRRHRHSALAVLQRVGLPPDRWQDVADLMADPDDRIAAAACGVELLHGPGPLRRRARARLAALETLADFRLRIEIGAIRRLAGDRT